MPQRDAVSMMLDGLRSLSSRSERMPSSRMRRMTELGDMPTALLNASCSARSVTLIWAATSRVVRSLRSMFSMM